MLWVPDLSVILPCWNADGKSDKVEVPQRPYDSALRIPLSNVFKGQTAVASGVAVSGRLCSGVVQVGDRIRAVPGDEVANVRSRSFHSV